MLKSTRYEHPAEALYPPFGKVPEVNQKRDWKVNYLLNRKWFRVCVDFLFKFDAFFLLFVLLMACWLFSCIFCLLDTFFLEHSSSTLTNATQVLRIFLYNMSLEVFSVPKEYKKNFENITFGWKKSLWMILLEFPQNQLFFNVL